MPSIAYQLYSPRICFFGFDLKQCPPCNNDKADEEENSCPVHRGGSFVVSDVVEYHWPARAIKQLGITQNVGTKPTFLSLIRFHVHQSCVFEYLRCCVWTRLVHLQTRNSTLRLIIRDISIPPIQAHRISSRQQHLATSFAQPSPEATCIPKRILHQDQLGWRGLIRSFSLWFRRLGNAGSGAVDFGPSGV